MLELFSSPGQSKTSPSFFQRDLVLARGSPMLNSEHVRRLNPLTLLSYFREIISSLGSASSFAPALQFDPVPPALLELALLVVFLSQASFIERFTLIRY